MSRYEDLKKKRNTKTEEATQHSSTSRYQSIKENRGERSYGVDTTYINTFIQDAQKFLKSSQEERNLLNWHKANDKETSENRNGAIADLSSRSATIRAYLNANKSKLDEDTYKELVSTLDSVKSATNEVFHSFHNAEKYYSQWDTEEDYNSALEAQKDYNNQLNFDFEAGTKEIEDLEEYYSEFEDLRTQYITATNNPGVYAQQQLDDITSRYNEFVRQYGTVEHLKSMIADKRSYMAQAKRLQEGVRLSSVANPESDLYDPDFDSKSQYVSTEVDGVWGNLWSQYGMGYDDLTYEYINGADNGMRSEILRKAVAFNSDNSMHSADKWQIYDHMNEDEVNIYNYYYSKEGKEAAEKYLDNIRETLNYRSATEMFGNMEDKTALELTFGVVAGLDQFESGLKNLFNTEDDYIAKTATQIASGMVREDLADDGFKLPKLLGGASIGQIGYDVITTSTNMAPSILTSAVVSMLNPVAGQIVGSSLMGASAAGNAYQEALALGYDKGQARTYSTLVGASEAGLQYLLGGISNMGGKISGKAVTKLMNNVDDAIFRTAIKFGGNMLSEGIEEGLQEILTPWFKNLITGEELNISSADVLYSSLLGALTAGFMEGPSTIAGEVKTYKTGKDLQASGITAQRLSELGKTFSADTVAYQLAGRVNENTGAYTMGRLFNEIGATLSEQNINEITYALVSKGMDEATARKNAKALAYVVEGGQLSERQVAVIEANDVLAEVARTTLIDANTTWNQRSNGYNDMLKALADEMTSPKASRTKQAQQGVENAPATDAVGWQTENGTEGLSEAESVDASPAKVKNISSIDNGKVTIKLEDDSEVSVKDADLDPDDGVRIETIASIDGISATDATYILNTLRTSTNASAQMDALGAKEAYKYGFYGFSQDHMTKHGVFANSLTDTQRQAIYDTGKNARQQQIEKATPKKTKAKERGVYFDYGSGNVVAFKDADKSLLAEEKRSAGVQAAVILNKLGIGGDIYFFESYRNSKGQLVYKNSNGVEVNAPNGWYSETDGSIHIDLNAGRTGDGLVLFTLAHELTHFIEQWSPKKYKILADFLVENYEKGQSMDKLVRAKQDKLSAMRGKQISYQEAYSEVIADSMEAMLADGNVMEKLIELKAKDNSLFMKMKQFFDNLLAKIRNVYKGLTPDSAEGQAVLEMKDSIEKIQQLFAEALVDASENFQTAMENVVEENAEAVASDEIITDGAVVTDGEGTKFSIKSMKHDIAEGQMFEDLKTYCGWTQKQVNELRKNLTDLVEYMTPFRDIIDMNESYDREGRRFSPYKPNSDPLYKISMDFSTLCSKRLLTQYVIENLQLRENRPMSAEEQMAIRDMLNEYRKVEKGLQVACAMCYVEAARLKSPKQIQKWLDNPATQMKNYFADKNPEFAAFIKEKQEDFKESRGYARNATKKEMSAKDVRELNNVRPRLRSQYQLTAEEQAIVEKATSLPNSTYLTAGNLADLSDTDPTIYAAYTSFVRSATRSKSLETDEPYYYGDSRRDNGNGIVVSDSFIETVNRENGMRFSSWSDWRIQHLLDYITAVIDNSVRGAAMHGYTKFGDEVRVLGKTGMMFNMSGVAGTQTGLNEDGSLSFSPTESIDVNEAIQLREEFPETAGLQCIGVSDDHIVAMLRSDIIDYIIPYHVSGLNAALRRMADIYGWADYTSTQHAAIDNSIKHENAVDQEHWHMEPVFSEFFVGYDTGMTGIEAMRASADRYVQMCKDRGLKPKFEQFLKEENYWKLLIDRKMINQKTGNLIRQKAVTPTFDFSAIEEIVDRYVQNYDSGLEARALNHIVENWDSIPQRIKDLKKKGGTKAKKTSKAVDTLANQTLAAQPTKNSLREIVGPSGKNYGIGVHLDSTLLSNLSEDERVEMVKEYVKELGGSIFTAYDNNHNAVDVHLVEWGKKFKNKGGKKVSVNKDLTSYLKNEVKQEAIVLVDELILASTYSGKEPATHPHDWVDNNGQNDWDVWTIYIQDKKSTVWEAKLRIANSTNGEKILYDIFPINMVEGAGTSATTTTSGMLSQPAPNVNSNNSTPHSDRDSDGTKFSMRESVEETKDLLAYHNITAKLLADVLNRNGLLMPSLAVTNKGMTDFGEISLLFDKATIDPILNNLNKLYGADAWTPTQTRLKKNAKFDTDKTVRAVNTMKNRIGMKYVSELLNITPKQFKDTIIKADGSIYDAYSHDIGVQTAYAMEHGIISKIPTKQNGTVDKAALQEQLSKELDTDNGWRQYKKWLNNISDTVITSYDNASNEDILNNMKAQPATAKTFKLSETGELVVPAAEYGSIEDVRKNKNRLSENAAEATKAVADEFLAFAKNLGGDVKSAVDAINASFGSRYSIADIVRSFNSKSIKISSKAASELQSLYKKAVELPTQYFEAKPHREVGLDEIKAVVMPADTSYAELKSKLEELGIQVIEYDGSNKSRVEALNSVESLKFSDRDNDPTFYSQISKAVNRFGTTTDFAEAGFILPSGEMLRFTDDKHRGERQYDHRAIGVAYGVDVDLNVNHGFNYESGKFLDEFVENGGIRFDAGEPSLNMDIGLQLSSTNPLTKAQEQIIRDLVEWKTTRESRFESQMTEEDFLYSGPLAIRIDFGGDSNYAVGAASAKDLSAWGKKSLEYDGGNINADRIIADIRHYYQTGETRKPSMVAQFRYQERAEDSASNRSLLANAFEGVAQNEIERNKIREYKSKIDLINSEERKLSELNEQIKELSFSKGPRDTKAIRDLQFEARQTANRINTYDKQLLRLEASKPLQDVLTREKKMAYQRAEQKGKEALEAYREKTMKTQRELLEKWQESRKKGIDSRHKTAMRHKIKDIVNELNQYLLRGTKDRHVPIELQKAVAEALDAVNMDTVGAEERIAKLKDELLKAKTPEQIQEISRKIDNIQAMGDKMNGRLQKLKDAYDQFVNSDDPMIANSHDEVISNKLQSVIDSIGNTPLRDMTLAQLEDVYDMYRMVLTTIRNANKAFKAKKSESISTIANRVMEEVEKVGGKKKLSQKGTDGIKNFGWNNLKPVYAFEHIGSGAFTEVFNNVRAGEDVWAVDVTEAREYYLDKSKKHNYNSWDFKKRYNFTSTSGMDFSLDLEQIMSLYAYSKRDQAADHLKKGGIVIDETTEITIKNKLGIPVKFNPTEATAYNISDSTLADIISKLSNEQKAFVDEMQDYLSTVMGAKGNEVSLEMYGIKLFKEKFYFPLKSASQFMAKAKEQQQGEVRIKNSGFSKETVQKASNPIVLTPFMNVWANHVNEMSMYHAFVLPMEDFYRVYNYKTPTSDTMATESVEMFIQNAYGKGATKYIDQLLKDLNGGARTDHTTGFINKMMGLFKKGAVFASLSVVVQQPSAIARASALVDTKYFIGPKVDHKRHKALWDEVKQYAPVAIIKEMGYFDTNMGKSTQDFILGKEYRGFTEKMKALVTDSNYRDEVLSKAPALADEIAWCGIWEAVKRETKANNPGMDTKSEAFLKMAGERFTEVIVKTQVYDSVLSRSGLMRSKDTGMKMATAFMAEPTTSINMVADALLQGKRGNKKYCRAAIGAVIASQILNSILVSFVYAGRDDDEDETYMEKYIGTLSGEILDSLNPLTYIPFIKDIISIVKGYDVERSDMAVVSDLWNAIQNLKKDNVSTYRKVEGFAGSIAQIFGLPVKNIMRDTRGIYQTVMSFVNGQQTTKAGIGYAVKGAITGKTESDQQQLYEAYLSGDKTQIARVEGRFKDQTAINTAIRKALRENDQRIKEAAEAKVGGDLDEYLRLAKAIIAEKHFSQDNVVAAINAEINALNKGETTTSTPKESGMFKAEDFAVAISQGDQAMANAVKVDIVQTAQKNGKTAEEAEKSFVSSAKAELKNMFLSGDISESKAIDAIVTYCGKTEDEAMADVQYWAFTQDYPDVYADDQWFDTYYEKVADSGISIDVYMDYRNTVSTITGEGKKERRMAVINSLPISSAQKDALYFAEGWTASKLYEAPWH